MLLGGAAADRIDRRWILITSQVLQMTFAAILGLLYASGRLSLLAILALAFLTGLAQSQSSPTYQAVLTGLVPPRQIPRAVALNSLQFNLSRVLGPTLAGILLARAGAGWCFAANAASFLAVIVALWRIQIPSPRTGAAESLRQSLLTGLRHVRGSGPLSLLIVMAGLGSFLAFPLVTYLPVIATQSLGVGATGFARLLSSLGAGAILGAVVTAQRGHVAGRGRVCVASLLLYGATTSGAVLSHRLGVSMALLFVSGACLTSAFSILNSLMQENAPDALRGRVVSLYGFFFRGGPPLGSLIAGFLIKSQGAPAVLAGASLLLMAVALSVALRSAWLRAV
jgi:predicted MFS family arabinose efflux permease